MSRQDDEGQELQEWGGPTYLNEYSRQVCVQRAFDDRLFDVQREQWRLLAAAIDEGHDSGSDVYQVMTWGFTTELAVLRKSRPKVTALPVSVPHPVFDLPRVRRDPLASRGGHQPGQRSDG